MRLVARIPTARPRHAALRRDLCGHCAQCAHRPDATSPAPIATVALEVASTDDVLQQANSRSGLRCLRPCRLRCLRKSMTPITECGQVTVAAPRV